MNKSKSAGWIILSSICILLAYIGFYANKKIEEIDITVNDDESSETALVNA